MENQLPPPICAICGTMDQLLRCAKCKTIFYCSSAHQHMDWPTHKRHCRLLARQKNNSKLQQLQQDVAAGTLSNALAMGVGAGHSTNCNGAGFREDNMSVAEDTADFYNAIDPLSLILGTNENEIISSQAECVSQNSNSSYHGNAEANSTTMERIHARVCADDAEAQLQQQQQQIHQQQPYAYFNNQNNSQNERSCSYKIGRVDENVMGNANERRYEDLCRTIIDDMNKYGLSVIDDFLGMDKGLQILNEVHLMYAAGVFKDGQLVNNQNTERDLRTIRGDKITWVKGQEPGCTNVGYLINQIDAVICRANAMKDNGQLGNYNIKERTKAMVACYPGSGSHYVMHVDNPNKDGRVITAIYYLNVNWDMKRSGGLLRIFPEHGNAVADIEPKFDRLIFFWSDKRNPHEVQPAHRTRYAITVWYFDANEREAALNRCKHTNNLTNTKNTATTTTSASASGSTAGTPNANVNLNPSLNSNPSTYSNPSSISNAPTLNGMANELYT